MVSSSICLDISTYLSDFISNYFDIYISWYIMTGWWFQPLWNILVKWEYYFHYVKRKHVPNHQPDHIVIKLPTFTSLSFTYSILFHHIYIYTYIYIYHQSTKNSSDIGLRSPCFRVASPRGTGDPHGVEERQGWEDGGGPKATTEDGEDLGGMAAWLGHGEQVIITYYNMVSIPSGKYGYNMVIICYNML